MATRCALLAIVLIGCCLTPGIEALADEATELVPMGCTVGIEMKVDGVLVVGLSSLQTENGPFSPAGNAGIRPGDLLIRLGNHEIRSAREFLEAASTLTGDEIAVTVRRGDRVIQYTVKPMPNEEAHTAWAVAERQRVGNRNSHLLRPQNRTIRALATV